MIRYLCLICFAGSFLFTSDVNAAEKAVDAERLFNDVKQLASDEWEGRGVGTDGLRKAAEFIAESFREAGLNVTAHEGDAYQDFTINDGAELGEPNRVRLRTSDGEIELEQGKDFEVCSFGSSGNFEGELVFAGYGIVAKDQEYNDYEHVDVKDKVVIIMRRNPKQSDPHGPFAVGHGISRHAGLTTKVSKAFSRGAKAILFVNDPYTGRSEREKLESRLADAKADVEKLRVAENSEDELKTAMTHLEQVEKILNEQNSDKLMEFGYAGTRSGTSVPIVHITQEVCNQILKSAGKTLTELETQIDATGMPASIDIPDFRANIETSLEVVRVPVRNVIGVLEGDGPHADETIVIGAHFDHLGRGGNGSLSPQSKEIHNGADDNASGTAGLLELARRLGSRQEPLARRIVFIAFNGEERGLLGAYEYVKNPLFPLESTVAMLNMDMIGRLDEKLTVYGTGTSSIWETILGESTTAKEMTLVRKPEGFGPSDHAAFYGKKIPVLHLFTGIHDDYHRPTDDWDKLNVAGMSQIVDLLEEITLAVANHSERPDYIEIAGSATLSRSGSRPYFGSIPDFSEEIKGYAISGVSPGSPADKGGLKGGDVIVELGDKKIGGLDDFDLALREFSPGEQVDVTVLRDGQNVKLKVTLATPKN